MSSSWFQDQNVVAELHMHCKKHNLHGLGKCLHEASTHTLQCVAGLMDKHHIKKKLEHTLCGLDLGGWQTTVVPRNCSVVPRNCSDVPRLHHGRTTPLPFST